MTPTKPRSARARGERGTVAIVVAISATMIFALCALGVDLGSAFARKRDIQTQADLATLAAAAKLPNRSATAEAAIEQAATDYAMSNEVLGQDTATWNFSDLLTTNGYIEYEGPNKLRLFAPQSHVDFWLAPVAGLSDGMEVSAVAAAEIRSPGKGLPFFVSTTCGWGKQTILDQTAGPTLPPGPPPALTPTSPQAATVQIAGITPNTVDVDAGTISMTITSTANNGMNNVNQVGFTREGGLGHETVDVTGASGDSLIVTVPATVVETEAVWWVRLRQGAQNKWSDSSNAKAFVVGDPLGPPPTSCDSKNQGNFGSLLLSRSDYTEPSRWLVENMAQGLQHDLDKYPSGPVTPCASLAEAVTDSGEPIEGQALNCLETDTGSDLAQDATNAFIEGTAQGTPARLAKPTASGCDPDGGDDERTFDQISGDPSINDDVLSCFLEPGVTVGDVSRDMSTFNAAHEFSISEEIFESPRFFWIPVLAADPSSGGSSSYSIVDFRAVFITEQDDAADHDTPMATVDNGIEMASNGKSIEKIRIRTINPRALPEFSVDLGADDTVDYTGAGTKIVRLVE